MKLKHLSIINNYLTAIYYVPNFGWQYTIFLQDGNLFQPGYSYSSEEQARDTVVKIIELVIACDREDTAFR